jgi:hypothetical protein
MKFSELLQNLFIGILSILFVPICWFLIIPLMPLLYGYLVSNFLENQFMKLWEIWVEGWAGHVVQGEFGNAQLVGCRQAMTFKEAIEKFINDLPDQSHLPRYERTGWDRDEFDLERLTYWSCKLFDNESEARKSFG